MVMAMTAADHVLRRTSLFEEHRRLGGRMIEFAGWELPVWYTGVAAEHAAVRTAAGLFDIGHMGVLEITGSGAAGFLEYATTARASAIAVGRCHYTFVLDETGLPLDDIILYRMGAERFLAVVNAANAERVRGWLSGLLTAGAELRDLSGPEAGADQRRGIALQGPASARVLAEALGAAGAAAPGLRWFELTEIELNGTSAVLSRTGYTGERVGFEILGHPDALPALWRRILEIGGPEGVLPAGLGARDSLRIEAGLPLFGHELAGRHEITPLGAGYARIVDLEHEFVGREGLLAREAERRCEVVRFGLDDPGARAIRADDPVASKRGELAGWVTSCALAGERQVGMAWLDRRVGREGAKLLIYPARQAERAVSPADLSALALGDRMPVHETATVLPRFR